MTTQSLDFAFNKAKSEHAFILIVKKFFLQIYYLDSKGDFFFTLHGKVQRKQFKDYGLFSVIIRYINLLTASSVGCVAVAL